MAMRKSVTHDSRDRPAVRDKYNKGGADMWQVVTESGLDVFSGSKPQCKAYIRQALKKGSEPGFLRIVKIRKPTARDAE